MKGIHAAFALTAGAAVALGAGALCVACAAGDGSARRKVTSALSSLTSGSSCSLVVFKDDGKGVSATAAHVEWPRRASLADVCAAVDETLYKVQVVIAGCNMKRGPKSLAFTSAHICTLGY